MSETSGTRGTGGTGAIGPMGSSGPMLPCSSGSADAGADKDSGQFDSFHVLFENASPPIR